MKVNIDIRIHKDTTIPQEDLCVIQGFLHALYHTCNMTTYFKAHHKGVYLSTHRHYPLFMSWTANGEL